MAKNPATSRAHHHLQAKVDELEHLWLSLAQAAHEAGID